jgi:radical SAM superfamily enzyme YgiQ (UPF0313 family)
MLKIGKIVLIEPRSPSIQFFNLARMPRLGLPILGAILKRMKLKVKIFCENLAPINWQEVARADLVGISVLTNLAPRAYQIATKIKEIAKEMGRKIPIVMGGPHPTFLPEEALANGADFVIRYEGEETLKELVECLQGKGTKTLKEIQGLSYFENEEIKHNPGRPLVKDLDTIPLPDFSLIEGSERINFIPLQTSRGCPHDCEFCSVIQMFGRGVRCRSPESVIEEIKRTNPRRHIFINDDNFSADPRKALALLEAMKKAGIYRDWSTQETVAIAWKKEVMKLMRETGCVRLYQGLESFNPEALKGWHKPQTPEMIKEAISILHHQGFLIHGMFVLGSDFDTPETIRETAKLALRYGIDTAQFFTLVPPPGTRLYQRLKTEKRIIDQDWSHYDGHYVVFLPKQMTPWQLQELAIEAFQRFYTFWRGIKWAIRGKVRNSFFAFYGSQLIKKWLAENSQFLEELKRKSKLLKV